MSSYNEYFKKQNFAISASFYIRGRSWKFRKLHPEQVWEKQIIRIHENKETDPVYYISFSQLINFMWLLLKSKSWKNMYFELEQILPQYNIYLGPKLLQ